MMFQIVQQQNVLTQSQRSNSSVFSFEKYRVLVQDLTVSTSQRLHNLNVSIMDLTQAELYQRFLLHPRFIEKMCWDIFVGILIIYTVIAAPVQIAFTSDSDMAMDWLLTVVFFVDMGLSFRTTYYSEEHDSYIAIPDMIMHEYLRTTYKKN